MNIFISPKQAARQTEDRVYTQGKEVHNNKITKMLMQAVSGKANIGATNIGMKTEITSNPRRRDNASKRPSHPRRRGDDASDYTGVRLTTADCGHERDELTRLPVTRARSPSPTRKLAPNHVEEPTKTSRLTSGRGKTLC